MKVVFIRSRRCGHGKEGHPALKAHPSGWVQANAFGKAGLWEEWTVHDLGDGYIALQSFHGTFLSAKPTGDVVADGREMNSWEKWKIENRPNGFVSMRSCHGKYIACDDLWDCGKVVKADRDDVQEWEEWAFVDDPLILSSGNVRHNNIIGGVLLGAGTVLCVVSIAIPLAGFGAGGVVAGSTAAAVQSAVYGGYTTGVFSVLQSVGATMAWVPTAVSGTGMAGVGGLLLRKGRAEDSKLAHHM